MPGPMNASVYPPPRLLLVTLFIVNGTMMAVEMTASRLIAPHFGLTIEVWSGIIAVILSSLAFGAFWGGRFAPILGKGKGITALLVIAALGIAVSSALNDPLAKYLAQRSAGGTLGAVLTLALLWGPPSVILGSIAPVLFHLAGFVEKKASQGYGLFSAVATLGGITGTILAGVYLLPYYGSHAILYGCSVLLVITALGANVRQAPVAVLGFLMVTGGYVGFSRVQAAAYYDTPYARVRIEEHLVPETGWVNRTLHLDPFLTNASLLIPPPTADPFAMLHQRGAAASAYSKLGYPKFGRLVPLLLPKARRIAVLGGGGYTIPKDLLQLLPEATIDVVEIDPGITDLARRFYELPQDPRLQIFHEDARTFLARAGDSYDAFVIDVYSSAAAPPFWLMTEEAFSAVAQRLGPRGIVVTNLIGTLGGVNGRLYNALMSTQRQVFSDVATFAVQNCALKTRVQNLILLAANTPPQEPERDPFGLLAQKCPANAAVAGMVLRDDFAPVESYASDIVRALQNQ